MRGPGFQSFVAWRYLLARPRRAPRALVAMSGAVVLAAALSAGLAEALLWWFGRGDPREPFSEFAPWLSPVHALDGAGLWVARGVGAALLVAGAVLARAGAAARPAGGRRVTLGWTLLLAGGLTLGWGVVAGALLGKQTLVEWSWWWSTVVLAPLALLLPLLVFRYLFSFFTTVSMAGVFVGSMALVVVLSVMGGFENDLREKILGSNAHIRVTREDGPIEDWRAVMAAVAAARGVVAVTPYASSEVVISANSNYASVIIKGIEPQGVGAVTELVEDLLPEDTGAMEDLYPRAAEPFDLTVPVAPTGADVVDPAPDDMEAGGEPLDLSTEGGRGRAPEAGAAALDDALDVLRAELPPPSEPADLSGEAGDDDAPADLSGEGGDGDAPADLSGEAGDDDRGAAAGPSPPGPTDPAPDDFAGGEAAAPADYSAARGAGDAPGLAQRGRDRGRIELLDGVLVGKELEKQLNLWVGQEVRLVSPLADPANPDATGTPIPFHRDYRVAGRFYTGMYEYDLKFVYVPLESLQEFLQLGDTIDGIEVRVADADGTGPVRRAISAAVGDGYLVQDWKELNRNLFSALKLEKIAMFLVLAIIILVASFSIVGNLIMVVVEKGKEIALLKTLGASDLGVMRVFVMQGFFIGLVGTLAGVLEGLAICWAADRFGFPINPDVYYIDRLPIHVDAGSVALVAAAGLVISAVATLYPALIAARLRPAVGLRHE